MNHATKRRRWLWILVLALGPCSSLGILAVDDDPPEDADLLRPAPDIPEAENAAAAVRDLALNRFVPPDPATEAAEDEWYAPRPYPKELFAAFLAQNEAVLDRFRELIRSRRFQTSPEDAEADWLLQVTILSRWLSQRARLRLLEGRVEDSLDDAFALIAFGARLEATPRGLVQWTLSLRFRYLGVRGVHEALQIAELDEGSLLRLEERLAPFSAAPESENLAEAMRAEYVLALPYDMERLDNPEAHLNEYFHSKLSRVLVDLPLRPFVLKRNRCRRILATLHRRQVAYLKGGPSFPVIQDRGIVEELLTGNALGRELFRGQLRTAKNLDGFKQRRSLLRLDFQAQRVIIALRRFEIAEGRLPKSLAELCPRYLISVPLDLDGQPLRYRPELELLYSVGQDGDDDAALGLEIEEHDRPYSFKRRHKP